MTENQHVDLFFIRRTLISILIAELKPYNLFGRFGTPEIQVTNDIRGP